MAKFATETQVPVEKSKAEIEGLISRYGATGFISGWLGQEAMISFQLRDRRVRFNIPLPDPNDAAFRYTAHKNQFARQKRSDDATRKAWDQACRQRWRALLLVIKAKLEAVECGITTFDEEFMPHIVMPDGRTLGETYLPDLPEYLKGQPLPPLLPAGRAPLMLPSGDQ